MSEQIDVGRLYRKRLWRVALLSALISIVLGASAMFWWHIGVMKTVKEQHATDVQNLYVQMADYECWITEMTDQWDEFHSVRFGSGWSSALWDREMMAKYLARKDVIYLAQAREIVDHVFAYSQTYQLDPLYMFIFWFSESGGDHRAESSMKARGYTQVLLRLKGRDIWEKYLIKKGIIEEPSDLYDPRISVNAGGHIFRHYLNESIESMPTAPHAQILDRTVMRYKGGNDSKYTERIRRIFGHYALWVMTQDTVNDTVFTATSTRQSEENKESSGSEPLALVEVAEPQ